ncbi:MAG: 1-(5-phosphoribosyl)-5-[(5-phosphoribosylamino)methylideneamino]imidazole-4-carboxamide isomerase [Candidatus Omnitrophica bacterium]|nr:1-(5-phosphoribosyl)-5-[(5-phosphoribosylamino)methylideneamino]imidazole-4-carboxamide isomerase [Candidatus Omnitrophota bacterium]
MLVIPAIDLKEGKVVRLTKGAFDRETVYSASPADVMQKWQKEGAKLVHVVDLDGALEGARKNLGSLKNILKVAQVPVQFGGGLRTFEAVREVLDAGVWRVVLGTKAFDTELIKKLVQVFKERIAISIDMREGIIQTHGWKKGKTSKKPEPFCKELEQIGVHTVICTDITRDGTLTGPNVELLKTLVSKTQMKVIASGGVSKLEDLKCLYDLGAKNLEGVVIGKALYEQRFSLKEAIDFVQGLAT